jgi:hypothetical protein
MNSYTAFNTFLIRFMKQNFIKTLDNIYIKKSQRVDKYFSFNLQFIVIQIRHSKPSDEPIVLWNRQYINNIRKIIWHL